MLESAEFSCDYCLENMAVPGFCTPECSVAANASTRHQFGRRIKPAPPRSMLFYYNRRTGMKRGTWLPRCRAELNAEELEVVRVEMALPVISRIAFPRKKPTE